MVDGTKFGEFSEESNKTPKSSSELKGTKLGEMSDLEKSFFADNTKQEVESKTEVKEEKTKEVAAETSAVKNESTTTEINSEEQISEEIKEEIATQTEPESTAAQPETATEVEDQEETAVSSQNLFEHEMEMLNVDFQDGDIINGVVRSVEKSGIMVDIGYKSDGFITNAEFSNDPGVEAKNIIKVGDDISCFIIKLESKEGYTVLSRKRAEYEMAWNTLGKSQKIKDSIEINVSSKVEGGLVASYCGIKGFIPASQVLRTGDDSLESFVGKTIEANVLQVDRKRRKVIFSTKIQKPRQSEEEIQALLSSLEAGQIVKGKVTSIKDFGAFIDVGGAEGLVHISELSWARVNHPSELLKTGQNVSVFILGIDKENKHISLGMKQLQPDPWVSVSDKYEIGQTVEGVISRIAPFGAFIKLDSVIEGLIHISELSDEHVKNVEDVVTIGQTVNAKIVKLIPDEQKIGLSIKATNNKTQETKTEEETVLVKSTDTETNTQDETTSQETISETKEEQTSEVKETETTVS
jgi:small subunit ribosomal protein S1